MAFTSSQINEFDIHAYKNELSHFSLTTHMPQLEKHGIRYHFPYKQYFSEQLEIHHFEQILFSYIEAENKLVGTNKQGELCLRGFLLQEYATGGTYIIPIIYNLENKKFFTDYKIYDYGKEIQNIDEYEDWRLSTQKMLLNMAFVFPIKDIIFSKIFSREYCYISQNIDSFCLELKNIITEKSYDKLNEVLPVKEHSQKSSKHKI